MAMETAEALKNPARRMFGVLLSNEERRRLDEYARQHDLRCSQVVRELLRQLPNSATDGGQDTK